VYAKLSSGGVACVQVAPPVAARWRLSLAESETGVAGVGCVESKMHFAVVVLGTAVMLRDNKEYVTR
jgi:hypothetical protein